MVADGQSYAQLKLLPDNGAVTTELSVQASCELVQKQMEKQETREAGQCKQQEVGFVFRV